MKYKMLRISLALLLAVTVLFGAVSCADSLASTKAERRTVMTVDGFEVPYEMYRYAALMHLRDRLDLISADAENGVETTDVSDSDRADALSDEEKALLADEVKADAVATLTEIYSLFSAAKKEGIDPFGEMINTLTDMKMEELRATYESESDYKSSLELYHMNDGVYTLLTRHEIVSENLYEKYVKDGRIDITDEGAIECMSGEMGARAKQILISFERHSEDEAKALADKVYAEVVEKCFAHGADVEAQFNALTDKYGEDLFMFKNTDGYYITKGYNDKAFEEAVFALAVGEISDPVRLSAGYSIILRAEKDPAYIKENISALKEACLTGVYRGILEEHSTNVKIEYAKDFEELDIFSMN